MRKYFESFIVSVGLLVAAVPAFAEGELFTTPTVDASAVGTMVTSILAALAGIWACRKAVKMINRS